MAQTPYAELHCHTNFSFLDGASAPDDLVERAVELGLTGLAVTDHNGLYGAVRFASAAEAAGLHPVVGIEIELLDPAVADPAGIVVPHRRARRRGARAPVRGRTLADVTEGLPIRPGRPAPACPAIAPRSRRTCAGSASGPAGRTSSSSPARRSAGGACAGSSRTPTWPARRASRASARRCSPSTPRASSRCRAVATASSPGGCGPATWPGHGPWPSATRRSSVAATGPPRAASSSSCRTTSCPTTTGSWRSRPRLAEAAGLPVVVTNDVHYARPEDRELADVLTAIRHGRSLDALGDLRRPDGESYLKTGSELAAMVPGEDRAARAWAAGISTAVELAASCSVDLGFEQYRFPGFPVPERRDAVLVPRRSCAGRAPGSATTR